MARLVAIAQPLQPRLAAAALMPPPTPPTPPPKPPPSTPLTAERGVFRADRAL